MKEKIIGRAGEKKRIQDCLDSSEAELIAVYGRRRVGKTYLIRQYFNDQFDFSFVGTYNKPTSVQLENFAAALQGYTGLSVKTPENWSSAFLMLRRHLEGISKQGKKVVFFDEMPWMDSGRSDFLSAFEYFWNSWGATQSDLVFIVCGSATTWITSKLLNNVGGLYNRVTQRIYLHPFTLSETEEYLQYRKIRWSRYDITECYMIMGGIPFYLKLLRPEDSYTQNIDKLFFSSRAVLRDEFQSLYQTLFANAAVYEQVVEALATKRIGLTRKEIISHTKLSDNSRLTAVLENLTNSDFIRPYNFYGNKKRDTVYQLADYYTLFYLHFIKNKYGLDEHFWTNTIDNPSRRAWAGYAFEQVCKDHLPQIKQKLGIGSVLSEYSSWFGKNDDSRGAQIDLIIDRRDRVVNLCEMKFSINPFVIDKDYDAALRNKIGAFREATNTKTKALHLTLITTYGVKQNQYSGLVQSQVTMDDLYLRQ